MVSEPSVLPQDTLQSILTHLSTAGVNFIHILLLSFSYKILVAKITKLCFGFEFFWRQNIGKKEQQKMLMILTPGQPL